MKKTWFGSLLAAGLLAAALPVQAASYSGVYVFGDSLSDNGNVHALTAAAYGAANASPAAPYWQGRFSNGPVAVEYLAQALKAPLYDFAYGGAHTDTSNNHAALAGTGVAAQVAGFTQKLTAAGATADANALYVVWAGPNNFFSMTDFGQATDIAKAAIQDMGQNVLDLYMAGARKFLLPLMPDLGATADAYATAAAYTQAGGDGAAYRAALTSLSLQFNAGLQKAYGQLGGGLSGETFYVVDTLAVQSAAIDAGAKQGMNVTQACLNASAATLCSNPANYFYWDGVHPTTTAHALMGAVLANAVPEPSMLLLVGVAALGALGASAKRKRAEG